MAWELGRCLQESALGKSQPKCKATVQRQAQEHRKSWVAFLSLCQAGTEPWYSVPVPPEDQPPGWGPWTLGGPQLGHRLRTGPSKGR